ncbi:MAG: hypothetical protein RMJ43_03420 [Chloroherpetonaceae bacterium]|nr:hypothetical protein [Chthonomonadaceae bacterium]MDW8206861.1 hypothetical protein [Chloroherpetonaceae bacterium]
MTMQPKGDNRRVALIKSLATNNRFYALVTPESGIRNAETVAQIPDDLLLGIAYPCLEDGLNDFAVIRTTFETLDLFPEDDPIRDEMMEIIHDARGNLLRRLTELRDRIRTNQAHFLGTDYNEFKGYALDMAHRGYPRRNLDSMMKLNVFSSVAEAEGHTDTSELLYYYEFANGIELAQVLHLEAREFIVTLFEDVLRSVKNDGNYKNKYLFDRNVFQKFIAVMFVNYATTDPMFYGINKKDYAVSVDKDMDDTPLYRAIRAELLAIEQRLKQGTTGPVPDTPLPVPAEPDFSMAPELTGSGLATTPPAVSDRLTLEQAAALLPGELVNEENLLGPIHSLCSAANLLIRKSDPETQRYAQVILADASKIVSELKRLGIVSPLANDPGFVE